MRKATAMQVEGSIEKSIPERYNVTFMTVKLIIEDVDHTEQFFVGQQLPNVGDAVEFVYVGQEEGTGALRLMLRAKR